MWESLALLMGIGGSFEGMTSRISEMVVANSLWGEMYGIFPQQLSYATSPALWLVDLAFVAYELAA